MKITIVPLPLGLCIAVLSLFCYSTVKGEEIEGRAKLTKNSGLAVNTSYFIETSLTKKITKEKRKLSDGAEEMCYVITTTGRPSDHSMGPWSPKHVDDTKEKGGIWFKDGKMYDVDGLFLKNLSTFYDDSNWNVINDDGTVKVTSTKEAFEAAARPDVDPAYRNHVVEGKPEWISADEVTYVIPIQPKYQESPSRLGRDGVGVALNGVRFDPPAPVHMIIRAYTVAPMDDAGGHVNPHAGYHYHAATGKTKEVVQSDGHAPMIGYAMDGFAIYAHLNTEGKASEDLDECGGHFDEVRGYHYHVSAPGENQIIKAFRGPTVVTEAKHRH